MIDWYRTSEKEPDKVGMYLGQWNNGEYMVVYKDQFGWVGDKPDFWTNLPFNPLVIPK